MQDFQFIIVIIVVLLYFLQVACEQVNYSTCSRKVPHKSAVSAVIKLCHSIVRDAADV